jgi:hypothetical protein
MRIISRDVLSCLRRMAMAIFRRILIDLTVSALRKRLFRA